MDAMLNNMSRVAPAQLYGYTPWRYSVYHNTILCNRDGYYIYVEYYSMTHEYIVDACDTDSTTVEHRYRTADLHGVYTYAICLLEGLDPLV